MIKLSEEDWELYDDVITFIRYWTDCCHHDDSEYVCSFFTASFKAPSKRDRYDLYLFKDRYGDNQVCVRYGNEPGDYISPGSVVSMILRYNAKNLSYLTDDPYLTATYIFLKHGALSYALNP